MIDLFDLYNSFKSYVNTYQGGFYRPQTDYTSACNDISMQLWVKWTNIAEKSTEVKDNLSPFLKSKNLVVKQSGAFGTFPQPQDYGRFSAARIIVSGDKFYTDGSVNEGKCDIDHDDRYLMQEAFWDNVKEKEVKLVDNNRWAASINHLTKKPTFENPIMRVFEKKFQVAPRQVSVIVLDYYIQPSKAVFAYNVVPGNVETGAGDLIQYDQANSKPLEWPASLRDEFLINLGERYGLFTRDSFVSQVALQQKQTV